MNARKENRTLPYALIVKGIAVGCFAGLTAVVYRKLLSVAETVVFEAAAALRENVFLILVLIPAALLIGFLIKDNLIERVRLTASVLLAHLALLFVPAGVGIVRHWDRISAEWIAIAAILVVGTAITMAVTALVIQWSAKLLGVDDDD